MILFLQILSILSMPPKTSGKAAAKTGNAAKVVPIGDKKRKGKRKESYAIYIYI